MSELKIYPDGTPFTGVIGRTTEESSPAWPTPIRARDGAAIERSLLQYFSVKQLNLDDPP